MTQPSVKSAAMPDARIIPVGYPICLQATDPARNIARRYTILLQRDFFGVITVDYSWGRIGSMGQCRRASFTDIDQAERFARKLLTRRESARKRIGVPYRPH
ncbi:WGR domain-containing protein [Tardiphaga sp.]|uniref:WGR domain-containing protein n=1 Tax=Tardiphaga sp. TaxID=1926292 RepID=UPI00352BBECA